MAEPTPSRRPEGNMGQRTCSWCGEEKPLNRKHFYLRQDNKERYQVRCISCNMAAQKAARVRLAPDALAVGKATLAAAKKGSPAALAALKRQGVTAIWNGREMVRL